MGEVEPPAKRLKTEENSARIKGFAAIKPEFLASETSADAKTELVNYDDDEPVPEALEASNGDGQNRKKRRGQNKNRNLNQTKERVRYCNPENCERGEACRNEHNLDVYLGSKPPDLDGKCPVYECIGWCPSGLRCRWLGSHFTDGKVTGDAGASLEDDELNRVSADITQKLQRKQYDITLSEDIIKKMDEGVASFSEGRLRPSEKKYLDYRNAKVLSPLTTVGNLPFRRLMKTLGADITFSEMALGLPMIQGQRSEWALARAHASEKGNFVFQLAAPRPWQAIKTAQIVSELAPGVSELNLNCGCPIDLLYRQGAGSALMDQPNKIIRILQGMNAASDLPVSIKMRMGTKDSKPTAKALVSKIVAAEQAGCITLHGRSRQQRYSREADWEYVREVADVLREERETAAVKPWLVGNGDVYSWQDWYDHLENSRVDTCMVARGALIKPWIFEEIDSRQYLDKSSTERLDYVKQYAEFGLEHWGSDEYGVNQTRRFLCEWLSFTHRYIPVAMLENLPPKLNERPPAWHGRDELEQLLGSGDYKDWIKISEMFLGPAGDNFNFQPKHKSNSYTN